MKNVKRTGNKMHHKLIYRMGFDKAKTNIECDKLDNYLARFFISVIIRHKRDENMIWTLLSQHRLLSTYIYKGKL